MSVTSLSEREQKIFHAIKSRFTHLNDDEVIDLIVFVQDETAKQIGSGNQLAFVRITPTGEAEIITYALELMRKQGRS